MGASPHECPIAGNLGEEPVVSAGTPEEENQGCSVQKIILYIITLLLYDYSINMHGRSSKVFWFMWEGKKLAALS